MAGLHMNERNPDEMGPLSVYKKIRIKLMPFPTQVSGTEDLGMIYKLWTAIPILKERD